MQTPSPLVLAAMSFAVIPGFGAPPEFISPEVSQRGDVTFRFYAPNAQSVAVEGLRQKDPLPMTKNTDGVWSAEISLAPDVYSYTYNVDGATALDPRNPNIKKWMHSESAVEVTAGQPTDFSLQDVPHGVVHRHTYGSAAAGRQLSFQVYTPPGYNPRAGTRYPVVFLFHGYGDDETAWVENGRAHYIADNLIARKAAKPTIIVMPYGHPVPISLHPEDDYWRFNDAAMETAVLKEILPYVEENYAVSRKPQDRAIVGLSMGGGHALGIGLGYTKLFRWVGGFSSATPGGDLKTRFAGLLKEANARKPKSPLLWIGIGREDFLLERNRQFTAWLTDQNVPFTFRLTEGGHEWTLWREYLAEFLQVIFRDSRQP